MSVILQIKNINLNQLDEMSYKPNACHQKKLNILKVEG